MAVQDFAGFGIKGFRSYGGEELEICGPMSKLHFIVGRNNVGKSNMLALARDILPALHNQSGSLAGTSFGDGSNAPAGWEAGKDRRLSIGLRWTDDVIAKLGQDGRSEELLPALRAPSFSKGCDESAWFDFAVQHEGQGVYRLYPELDQMRNALKEIAYAGPGLGEISSRLTSMASGEYSNYVNISSIWAVWDFIPQIVSLDAVRELTAATDTPGGEYRTGRGLVADLARLQGPDDARPAEYAAYTARWDALQKFIRAVLGDETARLQVPENKATLYVHREGSSMRRIEHLGTGISEIVLIAALATSVAGHLICIEEPESHLHPALQRLLVQYLLDSTDNHYLISTHSATIINTDGASISHATMPDRWSRLSDVTLTSHRALAVSDLGNRASDIIQSNFVVWVEGPSDRLYIAHWLAQFAPDLIEGVHYSIVFYGGALLNHLAVDDEATNEFIDLLKINRNLCVVIDSDRRTAEIELNATKRRVIAEAEAADAMAWVTHGYTIENYVPTVVIQAAVADRYPEKTYTVPEGRYASPLGTAFGNTQASTKPNKVTVARAVIDAGVPEADWIGDLADQITSLVNRIRKANGLSKD